MDELGERLQVRQYPVDRPVRPSAATIVRQHRLQKDLKGAGQHGRPAHAMRIAGFDLDEGDESGDIPALHPPARCGRRDFDLENAGRTNAPSCRRQGLR